MNIILPSDIIIFSKSCKINTYQKLDNIDENKFKNKKLSD